MPNNNPNNTVQRPNDQLEYSLLTAWLESSDMGFCVVDDASHVIMLNKAACGLLGIDGASMHNQPLKEVLRGIDNAAALVPWIGAPGFEGQRHVTRSIIDTKQHLLLKFRSIRQGTGSKFKMLSVTDITSLLATEQLEQQRRQWQAMNAGVVVSDALAPDMPVVYVNPMFEAMSGYSAADMLGRNCRHLQGKEPNQPGLDSIRQAVRTQTNGYAVLRNYRKDGSLFVNELFISPIKDAAGKVTHFMGIQHVRGSEFPTAQV
jgi:PAS domain S-box-containing protein